MIPEVELSVDAALFKQIQQAVIPHLQKFDAILQKHSAEIAQIQAQLAQSKKEGNPKLVEELKESDK